MAKKRRSSQFKDTSQVIDIEEARKKRQEKRKKQQHHLRTQEEAAQKRAGARSRVKAGRRKKHITYIVVILCIVAAVGLSMLNIVSLRADYNEAKAENERLQAEKEALEQQLEDSDTKEYIEDEARQQLRMVKPGETVYIVPNQESSTEATEESEKE